MLPLQETRTEPNWEDVQDDSDFSHRAKQLRNRWALANPFRSKGEAARDLKRHASIALGTDAAWRPDILVKVSTYCSVVGQLHQQNSDRGHPVTRMWRILLPCSPLGMHGAKRTSHMCPCSSRGRWTACCTQTNSCVTGGRQADRHACGVGPH